MELEDAESVLLSRDGLLSAARLRLQWFESLTSVAVAAEINRLEGIIRSFRS